MGLSSLIKTSNIDIKNISIPGGDVLRRPIYTSAVAYYKLVDMFKSINR